MRFHRMTLADNVIWRIQAFSPAWISPTFGWFAHNPWHECQKMRRRFLIHFFALGSNAHGTSSFHRMLMVHEGLISDLLQRHGKRAQAKFSVLPFGTPCIFNDVY